MEVTKLTFQANEQDLVKTSGTDVFASDTVSYIEADFTLGTNWTGYDSVRAMWKFGSDVYATVLDSDGKCIVPHEVLTKRGELKVNLVGSISENGVLTDRLTTFPILALVISKIAQVEGDNSTAPTASEYEQFVENVHEDAERAVQAKTDAESARDLAQTYASNADSAANVSANFATSAMQSATQAESSASASAQSATASEQSAINANQFAQSASQSAQSAQTSAQNAQASAESASDSATSAQESAEQAEQAEQSILGLEATASVDNTVGTPSVEVTVSEVGGNKVMDFDFSNLKGEQGVQGETGEDGFSPTVEVTPTTDGHEVTITDAQGEHTFEVKNGTVEDIYPFLPTDTASGDIASFSDGADDVPVEDLTIAIEPVQSGSGDPSPTNIRPISGWTGAVVSRTGINVWDEEWEVGAISSTSGNNQSSTERVRSINYIPVIPNTTYYYKGTHNFRFFYYDAEKNFLDVSGTATANRAVPIPENCWYIRFIIVASTMDDGVSINYPSLDTSYHAYQGNTYSISWETEAGTVYGGSLDVTTGLLTVDRAMVESGSLNWYRTTSYQNPVLYTRIGNKARGSSTVICSKYAFGGNFVSAASFSASDNFTLGNCTANEQIFVRDDSYTDAAEFKTAMNGVQVCYLLAEPITYQLTPTEVRTLLGDNNIWADTGGEVEVTYRADIQKYIDKQISAALNA